MTSSADRGMEPPAAPNKKDYACGYCPASFQTPAARYNHRRQYHRVEQQRDRAIANSATEVPVEAHDVGPSEGLELATPSVSTEMDGVRMDSVHELTRRLADALDGAAPDMATIKKRRQVEHRLACATRAIGELTDLGLPLEQLPDMATRLHRQARQQGVEPDHFLDWFYFCLEGAGSLLGLESLVNAKREQLQEADRKLREVTKKQDAATATIRGLAQQMVEDRASRRSIIAVWKEEIRVVTQTIRQEVTHGEEGLRALATAIEQEVRQGLVQVSKTAVSLGRLEESVNSYAIVRPLVSLLQGKNQLSLPEARIAATALCLGLLGYLERNPEVAGASVSVGQRTKHLLEALETWHP